jgi:hypothetical protein
MLAASRRRSSSSSSTFDEDGTAVRFRLSQPRDEGHLFQLHDRRVNEAMIRSSPSAHPNVGVRKE